MKNKDAIQIIVIYQNSLNEEIAIVNHSKKEFFLDFIEPEDHEDLQERTGYMVVMGVHTQKGVLNALVNMGYTCI